MSVDKEDVKQAIDNFEDDNYITSKEKLTQVVKNKVNDYVSQSLELEPEPEEDNEDE